MKNYWASDYALNKRSSGIVYRFADGIVEITFEDYIRENPGKTREDFLALKAISDEIYSTQEREEHVETYKNVSLYDCVRISVPSAEEALESALNLKELEELRARLDKFLQSGILTEVQRRRFDLYCISGLTTRRIAEREGVRQNAVWKSLFLCQKKFLKFQKKFFEKGGQNP